MKSKNFFRKIRVLFGNGFDYGMMKLFGRFFALRRVARALTPKKSISQIEDGGWSVESAEKTVSDLKFHGYSLGVNVETEILEKLLQYAKTNDVHGYMDPSLSFKPSDKKRFEKSFGKELLIAHYPNLHKSDLFKTIENNEVLKGIAESYCGVGAKCIASQMWWTYPAKVDDTLRSKFAHFYHRDLDGFNFIKFFVYLTDVESGDGGHFFVSGSHRPSLQERISEKFKINRLSDYMVASRYRESDIKEMTGAAGTVIVEDTFGLHKGQTPSKNPRLLACFVFGMKNYHDVQRYIVP